MDRVNTILSFDLMEGPPKIGACQDQERSAKEWEFGSECGGYMIQGAINFMRPITKTMQTKTASMRTEHMKATGTVRLHRVLTAPAERIYKAILDPAANCKWLAPHGFTCTVHHLEARVGGTYKMSFTNFTTGNSHSFGGKYLELVPGERIVATDVFDDPNMPGEMRTTYTLKKVSVGTEITIVQEGIPAVIPEEACYLGWQESLEQLADLVEPEIPDPQG